MSADPVDVIARTLLYEGYLLYPYRPSAVKNQQRFNFGVLYPEGHAAAASRSANDAFQLQMECPVAGDAETRLEVSVRFLQLVERQLQDRPAETWHEAVEREFSVEAFRIGAGRGATHTTFGFPLVGVSRERQPASVRGSQRARTSSAEMCGSASRRSEPARTGSRYRCRT